MSTTETLEQKAMEAVALAYAPYSGYRVGAAIQADDGSIYQGANIESCAYPVCLCAERVALAHAVMAGHRHFVALAVVTPSSPPGAPCGVCRQALAEFAMDLKVILINSEGQRREYSLQEMLPHAFMPEDLQSMPPHKKG